MKLKIGSLYEIEPGEWLLVKDPYTLSVAPGVKRSTMEAGGIFTVLFGPIIKHRRHPFENLHTYFVLFDGKIVLLDNTREATLSYSVRVLKPT